MSVDAIERMEMMFIIGIMIITTLFYGGLGVVTLVVASKKNKTNPKDAKNWKTLSIILFGICAFEVLGIMAAFVVPYVLSNLSVLLV